MKLIKPSFEIKEQEPGYTGMLKHIEWVGRHCYKSLDKITEDSAEKFVNMLVNRGHTAMVEHGTVYLKFLNVESYDKPTRYLDNSYSYYKEIYLGKSTCQDDTDYYYDVYVTTNYRVLLQNGWLDDLKYQCEPTEFHEKRITVKFVCDRGVSHEFVRHRVFSFAQESTRYCNYSKDKFGNEVTFIIPCWADGLALQKAARGTVINHDDFGELIGEYYYSLTGKEESYFKPWEITPESNFVVSLQVSEKLYLELLNQGWKPQQARAVLPNSLKTELVMTGTIDQWKGFFKLRDDEQHAHPQAYELAHPLHEEFIKRGYITE